MEIWKINPVVTRKEKYKKVQKMGKNVYNTKKK